MTAQVNIINDLSNYTKVPAKVYNEIIAKEELCIGSAIHDALEAKEEILVVNIGIGTLSINLADMQCKFVPSKDLKTVIKKTIANKVDPLEWEIEQTMVDKLLKIYNEAF